MKTYQPKKKDINRHWHHIDVKNEVLGRSATRVANLLMGKHKVTYSNHIDMGDYVVVLNADKVELTGNKKSQKIYYHHSGYPGGFKEVKFSELFSKNPKKVIELAVSRMLPDNRLKRERMRRMKIIIGDKNPYAKN